MPELGTVNSNNLVGGTRLGAINTRTTVEGSDLGAINSRTSITAFDVYKFNFGGTGGAPSNPGWFNVWGEPYVDANLATDVDFGNVGLGIGARTVNTDGANCWGEFGNTAISNQGEHVSTLYPVSVTESYWFVRNRIATLEFYNHTGTPLTGKTFTVRLFGSRANDGGATGPRVVKYRVNGATVQTLECFQNASNVIDFTGVTLSGSVISITVEDNVEFGYLNAIELIQTA